MKPHLGKNQKKTISTRAILIGLWYHLSRRRRFQLAGLIVVMLASGISELLSLGAILPFLAVLSDPEHLWEQPLVKNIAVILNINKSSDLLIPAIFVFALVAVLAALIRLINLWFNGRLSAAIGSDLSCDAYRRTLYQPYSVHVQRNTSVVITATTTQISRTVNALSALLQLVTSGIVAAAILTGLVLVDVVVAIATAFLFGSVYILLALLTRRELRQNSILISSMYNLQVKFLQEGLGAIRDVLLDGNQQLYVGIYRKAELPLRNLQAKNRFLSAFPRYAIEALGLVAISVVGGFMVLQKGLDSTVIPVLGALALGAQRLLPALQQVYSSWSAIKSYTADLQGVLEMLNQPLPSLETSVDPLILRQGLSFKSVHFSYGKDQPEVLRGLNLEVSCGERIGIVGKTGSGKSTTVDLIMGLLSPTSGHIFVDGCDLHDPLCPDRLLAWRASIAHVPQSIYLSDSSIAQNIAFGIPEDKIDFDRVRLVANQAQIGGFIESSQHGYDTVVGERGICLSGGQRQRIGIARALYRKANVLILDEATSALDNNTELNLMEAIDQLNPELTIIMVAHRLSTLKSCDRIISIDSLPIH